MPRSSQLNLSESNSSNLAAGKILISPPPPPPPPVAQNLAVPGPPLPPGLVPPGAPQINSLNISKTKYKHMTYAPITKRAEPGSIWDKSNASTSPRSTKSRENMDQQTIIDSDADNDDRDVDDPKIDLSELNDHFAIQKVSVQDRIGKIENSAGSGSVPSGSLGLEMRNKSGINDDRKVLPQARSLNINILLRQFDNPKLLQSVKQCCNHLSTDLKLNSITNLIKQLPDDEEVTLIKSSSDRIAKSKDKAEIFLANLVEIKNFKTRLECLEFLGIIKNIQLEIENSVQIYNEAVDEVVNCAGLKNVLHILLECTEVMKRATGSSQNKISGIKIETLMDLSETRSNKPGVTLLNFVIIQIYRKRDLDKIHYLQWIKDDNSFSKVDAAVKMDYRQIEKDLEVLNKKYQKLMTTLLDLERQEEDELDGALNLGFKNMLSGINSISSYRIQFQGLAEKVNTINVTWARMERIGARLSSYCMESEFNIQTLYSNLVHLLNFQRKFKEEANKHEHKLAKQNRQNIRATIHKGGQDREVPIPTILTNNSSSLENLSTAGVQNNKNEQTKIGSVHRRFSAYADPNDVQSLNELLNSDSNNNSPRSISGRPRKRISRVPVAEDSTGELSVDVIYKGAETQRKETNKSQINICYTTPEHPGVRLRHPSIKKENKDTKMRPEEQSNGNRLSPPDTARSQNSIAETVTLGRISDFKNEKENSVRASAEINIDNSTDTNTKSIDIITNIKKDDVNVKQVNSTSPDKRVAQKSLADRLSKPKRSATPILGARSRAGTGPSSKPGTCISRKINSSLARGSSDVSPKAKPPILKNSNSPKTEKSSINTRQPRNIQVTIVKNNASARIRSGSTPPKPKPNTPSKLNSNGRTELYSLKDETSVKKTPPSVSFFERMAKPKNPSPSIQKPNTVQKQNSLLQLKKEPVQSNKSVRLSQTGSVPQNRAHRTASTSTNASISSVTSNNVPRYMQSTASKNAAKKSPVKKDDINNNLTDNSQSKQQYMTKSARLLAERNKKRQEAQAQTKSIYGM